MKRTYELVMNGSVRFLLTITCLSLLSCTTLSKEMGDPIDLGGIRLKKGETDYGSVLHELGAPAKISALPVGFVFLYESISVKEKQLGLNFDRPVWRWLKISLAKSKVKRRALLVIFDDAGVLRSQQSLEREEDLGMGVDIQFIMRVASLVDTSHLEEKRGPNQWGFELLRPLPETLNRGQSLDTGATGLEQTGMPTGAGQNTLELR
jgi:hypothetical protein